MDLHCTPPGSRTLCDLPDSVLLQVLTFLSTQSLGRLARSCSRFRDLVLDTSVWKERFCRRFNVSTIGVNRTIFLRNALLFKVILFKRYFMQCQNKFHNSDEVTGIGKSSLVVWVQDLCGQDCCYRVQTHDKCMTFCTRHLRTRVFWVHEYIMKIITRYVTEWRRIHIGRNMYDTSSVATFIHKPST